VEEPPVQLDVEAEPLVADIPEHQPLGGHAAGLPNTTRESVGALDTGQIAVLQHRARALREVGEDAPDPHAVTHTWGGVERRSDARRSRVPGLPEIGEDCDPPHRLDEIGDDRDGGDLGTHPWRPGVPEDQVVESGDTHGPHSRLWSHRPSRVDGDVHRSAVVVVTPSGSGHGTQRRAPAEGGRPGVENAGPRAL
jgi:hypothetical protein